MNDSLKKTTWTGVRLPPAPQTDWVEDKSKIKTNEVFVFFPEATTHPIIILGEDMSSILLPPAKAAKGFVDAAIKISPIATAAASGYGAAIVPAVTALTSATASVTVIQTPLVAKAAITPPSKIGMNITAAILAQIVIVNATIVATTAQSVFTSGGPSPTFPTSAELVDEQLAAISEAIQKGLITPQL